MHRIALALALALALASGSALAEGPIADAEKRYLYRCEVDGVSRYTNSPAEFPEASCNVSASYVEKAGGATILTACLDPAPPGGRVVGVGPSRRARECTRQLCDTPEAREAVRRFALSLEQSAASEKVGDICTARKEADIRG